MIDPPTVSDLPGVPVLDIDGDVIGSVDRVYIHQDTGALLWVSIRASLHTASKVVAPLDRARFDDQPGSALHIGFPRGVIEDAPSITSVDTLTASDVRTLRSYYNTIPAGSTTSMPDTSPRRRNAAGVDVIRSEERLRARTISQPTERIRFQKVIVTEEKSITVTIRHEELRIIREPLLQDAAARPPDNAPPAEVLNLVLHEEQVVVTTMVVPVERVAVRVTPVIKDQLITDIVRKERIEVDDTTP
jgi:uncharacterized protein (TIGR02271 family)